MKWAILFLISIFICICCGQMLEWDAHGNLIAHSYSVWGDWSAHFTFISNLKERGLSWLTGDNPVFFGMPFQYPFLSHLFTVLIGFFTQTDVPHATFYTSMALLFFLPFAIHHFFQKIGLTTRQSILGIILFLFLGGFQAFDSSLNPAEPLTNQFKNGSVFTQIVLFELFPQRAFLFGIILLLGGLSYLLRGNQQSGNQHSINPLRNISRLQFFCMSTYFALLAWMHLHSWIAMGAVILIYFTMQPSKKVLQFGTTTAALSTPLLAFLLLRHSDVPSLQWKQWFPGWAQNSATGLTTAEEMNVIWFWLYNTALFMPLAIFGKLLLWRKSDKNFNVYKSSPIVILATAGGVLFLIAELINIQPYYYDNLKLFTYAFLFLTPLAAIALDTFFNKKYLIPAALILIGVQSYTGVREYLFFKEGRQSVPFFNKAEFDIAARFGELRHSPNSLVLITPVHNHWVPALAGNPVMMGYPGWLWSWGIAYQHREAEVNEILSGGQHAMELLNQYPVEYIVVNDQDKVKNAPVNIAFLRSHTTTLLEDRAWHVFQVNR